MFAQLGSRKYAAVGTFLALTIILALVQLYYATLPLSPRAIYHHGIGKHLPGHHHGTHPHNDPANREQELGWSAVLSRPRRQKSKLDESTLSKTFLMLKTGGEVMWNRLPVHFHTTFTRFPNFAIYSDDAAHIGNYEVIDILKELPDDVKEHDQLLGYRTRQQSLRENWGWGIDEIAASSGWDNDKFKNVPMLAHAWKAAPRSCDWFLMMDDDSFIIRESIIALVRDKNPRDPWYIGSSAMISGRLFAHGGSGMIISRGALDQAFGNKSAYDIDQLVSNYSRNALAECCGDLMAAEMLRDTCGVDVNIGVAYDVQLADPFQGNALRDTQLQERDWCLPLASWHHLKPWEMAVLHEWETRLGPHSPKLGATQSDIYIDLYLPFMSEDRQDWTIDAHDAVYTKESDEENEKNSEEPQQLKPASVKQDCITACEMNEKCIGWQFEEGIKCGLEENRIKRGRALNKMSKDWRDGRGAVSSGWMIERIRKMRAGKDCDPLQYDEETDKFSDDAETSEGWFFRLNEPDEI